MKALTIWQPWASLLAYGVKQYETRSWATAYRGPIAIHAAKKNVIDTTLIPEQVKDEMKKRIEAMAGAKWDNLPTGAVIATAKLVNVWHIVYHPGADVDKARHIDIGAESLTEDKHDPHFGDYFVPTEKEIALGDWTPGRYAWELANIKILPEPIPAKGKQGLWEWRDSQPMKPKCPYCGDEMTLVTLPPQFPHDLTHRYTCLRCGAEAPKGTGEQDAYRKATHGLILGK